MTNTATIVVIGGGNMGSSLVGGLIRNHYPANQIWVTDQNQEKLAELNRDFNIRVSIENTQAAKEADVLILAVKPQMMAEVLPPLAQVVAAKKPLIISVAAGIREASLSHWLKTPLAIVRAMPNTPALIGLGATALYANHLVTDLDRHLSESILKSLGFFVWIKDEKLMDVVTALSGSGPAYFFLMMECLEKAAIEMGLEEKIARDLTLQTAYGATRMALESGASLKILRQQVTSPGGTTQKAVEVLEDQGIYELFRKALQAAKIRSEEIAEQMGK